MDTKGKAIIFIILLMIIPLISIQKLQAQRWCTLCAMDLQKYRLTRYTLTLDDGSRRYTCSIHCAAIIIKNNNVKDIRVADYNTGNLMDANKAFFIVGSDITGVMSSVSRLAFNTRREAQKFQKKHGGELTDFKGALRSTEVYMSDDTKMIKQRVKKMKKLGRIVAEYNSCFVCHGIDGVGGIRNPGSNNGYIPGWNTEEFNQHINSKATLKEMILNSITDEMRKDSKRMAGREKGRLKMPAWKGFIKGKELHALTNYIWSLRSDKPNIKNKVQHN
ncbi:MAG: nitrous oxide reductase accessory protein NosL [Spirochaetota bacterium]|nr:nitrous oxide reductase accessory protein NosL [Spirochaetota bacterium]